MTIQLILEFIIALGVLIFVHEFGHFIVLKLIKIDVEEFGFGYPPRAITLFERGGTKYTLNWIPFGGFVRIKGQDDPNVPEGFAAASPWKRIAVLLAGPMMNLLLALVLFISIYGILGSLPDRSRVQLLDIAPGSPAASAGLEAGDILVSIGGEPITSLDTARNQIYDHLGQPLTFTYQRNGVTNEVVITPLADPGESGAVGVYMGYPTKAYNFISAIPESISSLYEYGRELFNVFGRIIKGESSGQEGRLVGLKGMYDMYASMRDGEATSGVPQIVSVLAFISSISISLAIFNLLPIPALDGGRIAFILPELIFRRRIPPKYEVVVNFVAYALLILLMIYINLQDFINPVSTSLP